MNSQLKKNLAILGGIIAVLLAFFGTRLIFSLNVKQKLEREAKMQVLRFESQLNGEIKLVLQMAKSPVVKKFLENPKDPFYSVAGVNEVRLYQESFLGKTSFWASTYDDIFWSNCEPLYKIDKEDPSQYWYKMTLYETDVYNFNINYNEEMKQTGLWLNAVVKNDDGKPIGMLGTGIPLDNFIQGLFNNLNSNDSFSMYTYNGLSEITGSLDQSLVEKKVHIDKKLSVLTGISAYEENTRFFSTFAHEIILMPMPSVGWTLVLISDFNISSFLANAALPFGLLLLLVFIIAIAVVAQRIFLPLNMLNKMVEDLDSGNADLTKRIQIESSKTLPTLLQLVDGFNKFIKKIQHTVKILNDSEEKLENTRVKLNEGTNQTSKSVEEISNDIDAFNETLKKQNVSVQQTAAAVNQIASNINSLDNMILTQSSAVSDASSAVEELLGTIQSVNSSANRLSDSFVELEQKSSEGIAKHKIVNEKIVQIKNESAMLAEANKVISLIASKTNLLAMNAAIEAAHAGEVGKGFSVVADEIRKLSENSSSQSKTISQKLSEIQKSIEEVVKSSVDAGVAFDDVSEKINNTNSLVKEITYAMHEQETGSKQISQALLTLNNSSTEVHTASKEMNEGNKTILGEVQILQNTTIEMDRGMDKLEQKSSEVKSSQNSLLFISKEMDGAISIMQENLKNFTV